jgi:hypothetical protein
VLLAIFVIFAAEVSDEGVHPQKGLPPNGNHDTMGCS